MVRFLNLAINWAKATFFSGAAAATMTSSIAFSKSHVLFWGGSCDYDFVNSFLDSDNWRRDGILYRF